MYQKNYWFCFILIILLFIACKTSTDGSSAKAEVTAYITGVELTALDKERIGSVTNLFHSDTLKEQIVLEVKTLYRLQGGTLEDFYNALDSNADQRIPRVSNPLVWGKCWFRINKDIQSDGIIIKANDNILEYKELEGRYYFTYAISPFATHEIRMNKEYFQIKKGFYKIYAAWENIEGKIFADEIEVYIDISN